MVWACCSKASESGEPNASAWLTASANLLKALTLRPAASPFRASSLLKTPIRQESIASVNADESSVWYRSQYSSSDESNERPAERPSVTTSSMLGNCLRTWARLNSRSVEARSRLTKAVRVIVSASISKTPPLAGCPRGLGLPSAST